MASLRIAAATFAALTLVSAASAQPPSVRILLPDIPASSRDS